MRYKKIDRERREEVIEREAVQSQRRRTTSNPAKTGRPDFISLKT